jgi:hypothetical protein
VHFRELHGPDCNTTIDSPSDRPPCGPTGDPIPAQPQPGLAASRERVVEIQGNASVAEWPIMCPVKGANLRARTALPASREVAAGTESKQRPSRRFDLKLGEPGLTAVSAAAIRRGSSTTQRPGM